MKIFKYHYYFYNKTYSNYLHFIIKIINKANKSKEQIIIKKSIEYLYDYFKNNKKNLL